MTSKISESKSRIIREVGVLEKSDDLRNGAKFEKFHDPVRALFSHHVRWRNRTLE
jgi:hypothetical protein